MAVPKSHQHLRVVPQGTASPVLDDDVVLAAWDSGSPRFGRLLFEHVDRAIAQAVRSVLGGSPAEHEDVVQASYEKLLVSLGRGQFQRGCSLRSWAAMIASRTALNTIRSRQTERRHFASGEAAGYAAIASVPARADGRLMLDEVRAELARLPEVRREAVVLHDVLGHELTEIAALVGVSVSAAQSRLVRGRKELHERLRARGLLVEGERK